MAGLYIHIPFCVQKCFYCAFHSVPASDERQALYFDALQKEISAWHDRDKPEIDTLYFGGGTPSFPAAADIRKTLNLLADIFDFDPRDPALEKTIEVNPASAMESKLEAYAAMGFNRLSVGFQAGQDHLLKRIGRAHTVSDFEKTITTASAFFENISADVIFGLPDQTLSDIKATLELITAFPAVKHVSCYSLSIEPNTVFDVYARQGKLHLPSEETERQMYYTIRDTLAQKGFFQYEISNFAKTGFESRHNSAYWDLTPYIGFGSGAASYYQNERKTNTADIQTYIDGAASKIIPTEDRHTLSVREQKGDFMFLGLRRTKGVSDADYQKHFGSSFYADYADAVNRLKARGLIVDEKQCIRLTIKGMDLANQVFMAFV